MQGLSRKAFCSKSPQTQHFSSSRMLTSASDISKLTTLVFSFEGPGCCSLLDCFLFDLQFFVLLPFGLNLEEYNRPFSLDELRKSLDKAHATACGPDDIHYQLLKHLPESALQVILDLMNDIWETGDLPSIWKLANVIPIPKPGKDHSEPSNYRHIALTSCVCKTMERMINARLVWFLESNGLLSNIQCGFRQGRSTLDHLVRFETFIRNAFAKKQHAVSIFFDLEKAYDTTWKYGILKDLFDMGLKGMLPNFISNFLSDREFNVRVNSTYSDIQEQEIAVI